MSKNTSEKKEVVKMVPQEEFLRHVIFMKDADKVIAVFPFNHTISDDEYEQVIESFNDELNEYEVPEKNEFCLMNEEDFGWGWIHNEMVPHLEVARKRDYGILRDKLVNSRIIKEIFVLNED